MDRLQKYGFVFPNGTDDDHTILELALGERVDGPTGDPSEADGPGRRALSRALFDATADTQPLALHALAKANGVGSISFDQML
eukprot:SAG31_NODE_27837_length_419_cov_1.056250_2_plen_82_part_01